MTFATKDSGQRENFESGMVRDVEADKIDYSRCFDGPMFDRWAELMTRGAVKYPNQTNGQPNWMLASGPEELQRFRRSAVRHFRQWLRGDNDEDHAAAVFFNLNGFEHVKQQLANGNP